MRRSAHLRVELAGRAACARSTRASRAAGASGGRLRLAGEGEVCELELGTLGVGTEQLGLLSVQEGERLRAGAVRLHAHPAARVAPSAGASAHSSPRLRLGLGRNLEQLPTPPPREPGELRTGLREQSRAAGSEHWVAAAAAPLRVAARLKAHRRSQTPGQEPPPPLRCACASPTPAQVRVREPDAGAVARAPPGKRPTAPGH